MDVWSKTPGEEYVRPKLDMGIARERIRMTASFWISGEPACPTLVSRRLGMQASYGVLMTQNEGKRVRKWPKRSGGLRQVIDRTGEEGGALATLVRKTVDHVLVLILSHNKTVDA